MLLIDTLLQCKQKITKKNTKQQHMQLINYDQKLDLLQKFSKTNVQQKNQVKLPFLHNVRCYFTFS